MKKKRNILLISIGVIFVVVIGILIGYFIVYKNFGGKPQIPPTAIENNNANNKQQENQSKNNRQSSQSGVSSNTSEGETTTVATYTAYGRFVGGIDAHSVEINLINTNFDYKSFELSDDAKTSLQSNKISEGSLVKIDFELKNPAQNPIILKIELLQSAILKGKFIGLSDNNFAEFLFGNHHVVLQITDVLDRVSNMDTDTPVQVEVKNNPSDPSANLVVMSIEALK